MVLSGYKVHVQSCMCNLQNQYSFTLFTAEIGLFGGILISKLLGITACVTEKLREIKKKHINEEHAKLIQTCHNKIEAIQPVIQECDELLASMDTFNENITTL